MNTEEILEAIDAQIAHLQQARELIAGSTTVEAASPRRGRPKGSTNKTVAAPAPAKASKRTMSAEAKARIAAAQRLRWAKQKNAAKPAKSAVKKAGAKATAAQKTNAAEA